MKRPKWAEEMINIGSERIILRYSRENHYRTVYKDEDGRFWICFYGDMVEVVRGINKYITVRNY